MKNYKAFILEDNYEERNAIKLKIIDVGQEHHLDRFVDDPDPDVRERIASRGFKSHLDRLVDDPHLYVRTEVARIGNKEHRDKLLNDKEWKVRRTVARYGNEEHRAKLAIDHNHIVRRLVAKYTTNPNALVALKHDPFTLVRETVALNPHLPIHHLRWMTKHDEHFDVRYAAMKALAKREPEL